MTESQLTLKSTFLSCPVSRKGEEKSLRLLKGKKISPSELKTGWNVVLLAKADFLYFYFFLF